MKNQRVKEKIAARDKAILEFWQLYKNSDMTYRTKIQILSDSLDLHESTVRLLLYRLNIYENKNKKNFKKIEIVGALEFNEYNVAKVSGFLGITRQKVRDICAKYEIKIPEKTKHLRKSKMPCYQEIEVCSHTRCYLHAECLAFRNWAGRNFYKYINELT